MEGCFCKDNIFHYFCLMRKKEVILVGAGGHALSLSEFSSHLIKGYIAMEEVPGLPGSWLGKDEDAPALAQDALFHMAFVYAGWPVMEKRRKLIEFYDTFGARFATLISPTAIITPNAEIGEGSAIMAGAIINRAKLGKNVIVNSGAIVEHDCTVGSNTFIGPGAVIGGFTSIGCNSFIGLGAKIGNNIKIGDNITVAMGAVVNKNLTEPGIYHGFPLKRYKI